MGVQFSRSAFDILVRYPWWDSTSASSLEVQLACVELISNDHSAQICVSICFVLTLLIGFFAGRCSKISVRVPDLNSWYGETPPLGAAGARRTSGRFEGPRRPTDKAT